MARSRTWNLRLNLDELNALCMSLVTDQDRALALQGIALGCNGGPLQDGAPSAFSRAWDIGHAMRTEAEEYRKGRSANGSGGGKPSHRKDLGEPCERTTWLPHGTPHGAPSPVPHGTPHGLPNPITASWKREPENLEPKNHQEPGQKTRLNHAWDPATFKNQPLPVTPRERVREDEPAPTHQADARQARLERWTRRRAEWVKSQGDVDYAAMPGKLQWRSYCRAVHPEWQEAKAAEAYDTLALRNWTQGGRKIHCWHQVADAWADNADQSEYGERVPMGRSIPSQAVMALSAAASGITTGEAI